MNALTKDRPAVAVLEDEPAMRSLLTRLLEPEFAVLFARSGAHLWKMIAGGEAALVLLDILLPEEDGVEIAKSIRARSEIPIVLLSGLTSGEMIATGINVGADDYVTKPFQPAVLRARLRNALRRSRTSDTLAPPVLPIQIGSLLNDPIAREIRDKSGQRVRLTEMEQRLLTALARHSPDTVGRDELSRLLSGQDWSPLNRVLDVHISHLRSKLRSLAGDATLISSFRGVGYAMSARVRFGA